MPKTPAVADFSDTSFSHSLAELGLVDAAPEPAFDALTRLAIRIFNAPVGLISIVDEVNDRQFFKSQLGLAEPWAAARQTPLSHSFCKHVKSTCAPLVVPDAPNHPLVSENLAVRDLNVIAYLGVPILGPTGEALGAICVIDNKPRNWTDNDVLLLGDLALCVKDEIQLRAEMRTNETLINSLEEQNFRISRYNALREMIVLAFMAPDLTPDQRFQALLAQGCRALGTDMGAIASVAGTQATPVFAVRADGRTETPDPISAGDALFAELTNGESILSQPDLAHSGLSGKYNLFGEVPGAVLAAPIQNDGQLFGVLEFSAARPRFDDWQDEELSMLSIIAMFASAHLALHGEINSLKRSETALLGRLLDSKSLQNVSG